MKILLLLICIAVNLPAFGQFDRIKNEKLRNFVSNFEYTELPIHIEDTQSGPEIDSNDLFYFLDIFLDPEINYENYSFGKIFFSENYFALVFVYSYTPGAFGINNEYIVLQTMDYFGNVIDFIELACFCYDQDMGINEIHYSEAQIDLTNERITINEDKVHATLFEEDADGDPFENHTYSETYLQILENGIIESWSENKD